MNDEWFDVAYINFDKAILHGRMNGGRDANGFHTNREIEQWLTSDQISEIARLQEQHRIQMDKLLKGFVDA